MMSFNRFREFAWCSALIVACTLLLSCGSSSFSPMGHGWPSQCGHVDEVLAERQQQGRQSLPSGEPDEPIDITGMMGQRAIELIGKVVISRLEDRLNAEEESFLNEAIPDFVTSNLALQWELGVGDVLVQSHDEVTRFLIRFRAEANTSSESSEGDGGGLTLQGGGVLVAVMSLERSDGSTALVFDAGESSIEDAYFGEENSSDLGDEAITFIANALESILVDMRGNETLVTIDPLPLGETGVEIIPSSLRAGGDERSLRIVLSTNVGWGEEPPSYSPARDEVATAVDAALPGHLLNAYTDSIDGRRVNKKGEPGGDNYTFFESVELHDGYLTVRYSSYSKYSLCAHIVLEMDIALEIVDGKPVATVQERRFIEASRQKWLLERRSPSLESTSEVMTEGISRGLSKAPLTFEGDVTVSIVPAFIDIRESGIVLGVRLEEGKQGGSANSGARSNGPSSDANGSLPTDQTSSGESPQSGGSGESSGE
jgi:hypothetical protein